MRTKYKSIGVRTNFSDKFQMGVQQKFASSKQIKCPSYSCQNIKI